MSRLVPILRPVVDYFLGAYHEFRRVTWPTRPLVVNYTILVIVTVVIGVGILVLFDNNMRKLTEAYLLR